MNVNLNSVDQDCPYYGLEYCQLETLRLIFQRNYARFLVELRSGPCFRVSMPKSSVDLLEKMYGIPFKNKMHTFDISMVMLAFVIDKKVEPQNAMAMSVIESLLGPPEA
jgi:hypothetical protein